MEEQKRAAEQALEPWVLDLLACPACAERPRLHLARGGAALVCDNHLHCYRIEDGIPILLVEEATAAQAGE